ncbi:hypothetical protein RclHR1_00040021 [Rhizophagus clarus]|uniref:F-box domain-containing protein n=1 Tax=Rhizophagus clarus TaxID=94130 RepID=A0A2Z6RV31_9GLOM|nr:hypothetical protein RclHR1_00040021 [Rhizophagus clarus]GES91714.1 hypothetical protein GLOIN_2v1869164 [Rhizophagus clarus]
MTDVDVLLPELTYEILQYFRYDYKSLHSCILVNKLWCRLSMPLLWEDPFSIPVQHNEIIKFCLCNLNKEDKDKYFKKNNNAFPNTFFNYSSFIKYLNTHNIGRSIENLFTKDIVKTKFIYWLFFKTIIENARLRSFEVLMITDRDYIYFYEIFGLISQRPNFLFNIRYLTLHFNSYANLTKHIFPFLNIIYSNCNSITSIDTQFHYYKSRDEFKDVYNNLSIEDCLSKIIFSQRNLKKILFEYNTTLPHSLISLKDSYCSNTLTTIIFYSVNFQNNFALQEVFNNLNVLESVHIINCYLDSNFVLQITSITNSFQLKTLFLDEILEVESLQLLLQKFGENLENFGIEIVELLDLGSFAQEIFKNILKYCGNIKILNLPVGICKENIELVLSLIDNIKYNLNYLLIDVYNVEFSNVDIELSTILLQNLGQILPTKLEYLCLNIMINDMDDFEIFLKNSQNTFIKRLLIRNEKCEGSRDIFPHIKKYIMKERRVKYLAIEESFDEQHDVDWLFLEDRVRECESYNIQIINYDQLYIEFYEFIKEMS